MGGEALLLLLLCLCSSLLLLLILGQLMMMLQEAGQKVVGSLLAAWHLVALCLTTGFLKPSSHLP